MRIVLVTYGDENYQDSLQRIKREASDLALFTDIWIYSNESLPPLFKEYTKRYPRGGGYWLWKPWVIHHSLKQLDEGDLLIYVDAGCTLYPHSDWERYFNLLKKREAIFFLANGKNGKWCKKEVFTYFNPQNDCWKRANQIQATALLIKKTQRNEIINRWYYLAENHPNLFIDIPKEERNRESAIFKEHRHDQSVLTGCVCFSNKPEQYAILPEKMERKARKGQAILASRISKDGSRGIAISSQPQGQLTTFMNDALTKPLRILLTKLFFYFSRRNR